ncbi:MAG: sensor histidine kinase [Sandaracinaceae bacterium]
MIAAPSRIAELMDPASELDEATTLSDIEPALRRDEPAFVRAGRRWEAIVPRLVVGFPSTRRLIDLPRIPVETLSADGDVLDALAVIERATLSSSPVVDGDRLVGRVSHDRMRHALRESTSYDVLSELSALRLAVAALGHDLGNALLVAQSEAHLVGIDGGDPLLVALDHASALVHRMRGLLAGGDGATSVSVAAAIERILPLLHTMASPSRLSAASRGALIARCPPAFIDRVLINLVANASDAMESPGTIRIDAHADRELIVLSVTDDGPGIAPEQLGRVVELGFSTKDGENRGIGLFALRRAARRLGGDLTIESTVGEGTIVSVRLPKRAL